MTEITWPEWANEKPLEKGKHAARKDGVCAMELVAWVAGEPHSDHPECASSIITAFVIQWNDDLPTVEDRERLIKPLLPIIIGTRTNAKDEELRAKMAIDWLAREFAPAWLELTPSLVEHAKKLRALPSLIEKPSKKTLENLSAAESAAWSAAESAARSVAWSAAESAWSAAESAAWSAAESAARSAAWSAARSVAWSAARSVAWSAVESAIQPTTLRCQESAQELVRRMCAVGRT